MSKRSVWKGSFAKQTLARLALNRRDFLTGIAGTAVVAGVGRARSLAQVAGGRALIIPEGRHAAGILEWMVSSSGPAPSLPPVVDAGIDRSVILGSRTYLAGKAVWLEDVPENRARWTKFLRPGEVAFGDASAPLTTAGFSVPGEYVLDLTGSGGEELSSSRLKVHVETAPPKDRLDVVYTTKYSVGSPLWSQRAKTLIVDWIPHCIAYCERTDIAPNRGDGGIDNFVEAGKANRGEPHATTSTGSKLPSKAPTVAAPVHPVIVTRSAGAGDTAPADNRRYGHNLAVDSKVWI